MKIRVLINGAHGKMGQESIQAIEKDSQLVLVGAIGKETSLATAIENIAPHVVIDFTTPASVFANTLTIINQGVHPVIGTTGLSSEQITELQQKAASQQLGGIIAPNFSLGAILMMELAKIAVRYFPDVEIIEQHHGAKIESPSGTALKTAALLAQARTKISDIPLSQELIAGARGANSQGIPIHSIRLPGFVATQEILFGGNGETLSIKNNAIHRQAYMQGVCFACKKVMELSELVYGLENILDIL